MKYVRRLTINSNVCTVKQKKKQDAEKKSVRECVRESRQIERERERQRERDEESKKWSKTQRNKMTDVQKKNKKRKGDIIGG